MCVEICSLRGFTLHSERKVEPAPSKTASVHSGGVLVHQFKGSVFLQKVQWQRLVLILALLPALLALNSRGGGSSRPTPPPPTLTIPCSPAPVDVEGNPAC